MALQHLINHISLIVDKSSSMSGHTSKVVQVFDRELNSLKQRSVDAHQETRISIYLFADTLEVLTFDMDVMRFTSLKEYYSPYGNTALLDAVAKSIEDHRKLPELYGDHAFLTYVITDGEENRSRNTTPGSLTSLINSLPDNWTTALLVPNQNGVTYAQRFGFNAGSVSVWDTKSAQGVENIGKQFTAITDNYMTMRSSGVRGTKSLFTLDPSGLNKATSKQLLEVNPEAYEVFPVRQDSPIKEYVEAWTKGRYRLGSTYYQPVKTVKVQDYKHILVQDTKTGKVYDGANLRQLLGLPDYTADVNPANHKDWRIFIQSTSANRKLFKDTFILVRK